MPKRMWVFGFVFAGAMGSATAAPSDLGHAREQWRLCIQRAIEALDDGISTASDIAGGVQNSCEAEYHAMSATIKLTPAMQNEASADRTNVTRQVAQELVLRVRAARRAQKASAQ